MALVVQLDDRRAQFVIRDEGGDVVPGGPAWDASPDFIRTAFWEILGRLVRLRKDEELASGLDAKGEPIIPATWRVGRYEGMTGPGLMPDRELSRTRLYFDVAIADASVTGFWRGDWSKIIGYHARGLSGKGRPITRGGKVVGFVGIPGSTTGIVRDVVGMTNEGVSACVADARSEWRSLFAPTDPETAPPPTSSRVDALGTVRGLLQRGDRDEDRRVA